MKGYLGASSSKTSLSSGYSREPYWEELTDEQKIEKLSRRAEMQDRELKALRDILSKLLKHTHSAEGLQIPLGEALRDDRLDSCYSGDGEGIFNREPEK